MANMIFIGGGNLRSRFDCPGVTHNAEECHGKCCINCNCSLCTGKCSFYAKEKTCCISAEKGICMSTASPDAGKPCRIKGWPPGQCRYFCPSCQW